MSGNNKTPPTSQGNPKSGSSANLGVPLTAPNQGTGPSPVYSN